MAQPTTYARAFNFAQYQTQSPFDPLPGVQVDTEYDRIRQTTDEIITNLNLIQRDDGQLENRSVGRDQIKTDLLTDFQLLTPTRVKQFVYDATNTVNEYQELAVNQTDFDDAKQGGPGTGLGFDVEFDFNGDTSLLLDIERQTFDIDAIQAKLEADIAALTGNIQLSARTGELNSTVPWDDAKTVNIDLWVEFINGLAATDVNQITLTFYEPGTFNVIAETPINVSTVQTGGGPQTILTGADRNSNVLDYVVGAPISLTIDGIKTDPANITTPNGSSIVHAPAFSAGQVICLEIGEAEHVATVDIEKLDDISALFDGVTTTFPLSVGSQPRVVNNPARLDVYIDRLANGDERIQEPTVDYTVSGSNIIFTTPPPLGAKFWGTNRTLVLFERGGIIGQYIANFAITNEKIADNTITENKLAFNISQIPVGGGVDYYDDVLPNVAPNTLVFAVGQTIGKCGSGADIEDDDFQVAFDIFKKRWNNVGTEDFDNLDVVLIPDLRGTVSVVSDKLKGKMVDDNEVGDFAGLEYLPTRRLCGTASTSGFSNDTVLTKEQINHWHAAGDCSDDGEMISRFWSGETYNLGRTSSGSDSSCTPTGGNKSSGSYGTGDPRMNNTQGHNHFIDRLPLDHSNLYTCTDRITQPYVVCEKVLRLK